VEAIASLHDDREGLEAMRCRLASRPAEHAVGARAERLLALLEEARRDDG